MRRPVRQKRFGAKKQNKTKSATAVPPPIAARRKKKTKTQNTHKTLNLKTPAAVWAMIFDSSDGVSTQQRFFLTVQ